MALFITGSVFAQDFSGRATYKTHRKSSFELDSTTMATNPGIQEQLEAQMRKMFQKTFTLDFSKSESMYKEQQAASGATASDQDSEQPKNENVVDADFEEVNEDTKQA